LGDVIQAIQLVAHTLHQALEARHWDRLIGLVEGALQNVSTSRRNHSIEQADSEEVLGNWLGGGCGLFVEDRSRARRSGPG
jgi:hypothetical protein